METTDIILGIAGAVLSILLFVLAGVASYAHIQSQRAMWQMIANVCSKERSDEADTT